jgi:hypothetical protein
MVEFRLSWTMWGRFVTNCFIHTPKLHLLDGGVSAFLSRKLFPGPVGSIRPGIRPRLLAANSCNTTLVMKGGRSC